LKNILANIFIGLRAVCRYKYAAESTLFQAENRFCIMDARTFTNFEPADLDKYTTMSYYLSRGAFGNVYGPIPWHGSQVAIKQVTFPDGKVTDDFKKSLEAKKVLWASLEHKNLLKIHLIDLTRLPKVMYLVMDFAAGSSLQITLRSIGYENKLPINVVTDWTKQIADGMMYLHEKDIVHRDLKSSNSELINLK
jgi:serine/threonine protein kinase